jgi:hypothetical protein
MEVIEMKYFMQIGLLIASAVCASLATNSVLVGMAVATGLLFLEPRK